MPRVLLLCEFPTLNGGERSLLAAAPGLQTRGVELTALCPGEGPLADELRRISAAVARFDVRGADGVRRPLDELRAALATEIRAIKPDLLHANSLSMGRVSGPVARDMGLPSAAHLRDIVGLSRRAIDDLNAHRRLWAVSSATHDHHIGQGLDADKTVVLYNGVDLTTFRPTPRTGWLHRRIGAPADAPLIGTVGQIILRKGHDVLLDAAERLPPDCEAAHFVIVGRRHSEKQETVEFEQELRRRAGRSPLAGRVHFLGVEPRVDLLLPELTLLVHPARQEPLGRVLLEAAACGLPILATDVGGTAEIFPPTSGAAVLIRPDDSAALAGEMARLLGDPELRLILGEAAHREAERFDVDRTAAKWRAEYEAVIHDEPPPP